MQIKTQDEYDSAVKEALEGPEAYWAEVAKEYTWHKEPSLIKSGGFENVDMKWFEDGVLNITENALDRHVEKTPNKKALIFEPNNPDDTETVYTYKEAHQKVCQISEALTKQGVKKGGVVCLYMSMIPELIFSVLACARIGAVHSVVFGGFSAKALRDRIEDCNAKFVITNDSGFRGSKQVPIKKTVDEAVEEASVKSKVLVWKHSGEEVLMKEGRDFYFHDIINPKTESFPAEPMNAEDPLFILYTSGSTGKPKGLLHTTAGYMIWANETFKNVFQMDMEKDLFWCTADVGWITGHSYMTYGPMLSGATQVIFEGIPTWPDAGRFWKTVDKYKVTHFYTAPTAIRALQACDDSFVNSYDLSSLKVLGSVGEPINEEAWRWYKKEIGKGSCPIVDTWWQTETGGVMISNLAGVTPEKATCATGPLPGVNPVLLDEKSNALEGAVEGHLCIDRPWPGMARTIFGDHQRFIQTYFSTHKNHYFTGDGAKRDEQGFYRIIGRIDDVVNVSGHRIGTAEVEDIITESDSVVEASVVGAPHDIKGQCLMAFVIGDSSQTSESLLKEVNAHLTKEMGAVCKLERIIQVPALPKTRSGKIMRRIVRKVVNGDTEFGDVSTLLNPEIVNILVEKYREKAVK
ncbi:MAG: acetate--CoA ligase [Bdellovibrionales bacterium]